MGGVLVHYYGQDKQAPLLKSHQDSIPILRHLDQCSES